MNTKDIAQNSVQLGVVCISKGNDMWQTGKCCIVHLAATAVKCLFLKKKKILQFVLYAT